MSTSIPIKHSFRFINAKTIANIVKRRYGTAEKILTSNLPDIDIPKVSLNDLIETNFDRYHNLIATECGVTGRKYTYDDIRIQSRNFNRAIRKKFQLQKGDVVGVLLPNSPEFALVALGVLKAGLVLTTMNPIYTPDEISRQLADSNTKAIVTLNELFPLAKSASVIAKLHIPIIAIKTQQGDATPAGAINFAELTQNIDYPDAAPFDPDSSIALLPYSSGTTGLPKGVKLSHYNVVANVHQFNGKAVSVFEETTKNHQDIVPAVLPQFHIYGLVANTINLLYLGLKTVTLPKFSPDSYLNVLRQHRPHVLLLAPPLLLFLTGHKMVTSEDMSSIRSVISAAAPLGALDEEKFLQKAQKNIKVSQGYGMSETSPLIASMWVEDIGKKSGSIGKLVLNTQAKIVDPNDPENKHLGPNKQGELVVKGPQVMKEYHNRPEETKNTFTEDGWLRTGDIMEHDEQGALYIKDRIKELIKVKGFQVPPAELEEIIRDFPNVEDAAVIGVPHDRHGEVPRAYVVSKKGTKIDADDLANFVNSKVADYKKLSGGIEFLEAIPKNASGKSLRRALKQMYDDQTK